jgi:hypothetical protein
MAVLLVGQFQRPIERVVLVLERKRIVAIEMIVGGEQIEDLADAEVGGVDFRQHLGKPQRMRRERAPGVGSGGRIESGEP